MLDFDQMPFSEIRRHSLANATQALPVGGLISWTVLAIAACLLQASLPTFAPYLAAAAPVPIAILLDKLRGEPGLKAESRRNPMTKLFMSFIFVVALLFPFVIIAAKAASDPHMLTLGTAILAGIVWVPYGWGADDPAAFKHFVVRTCACYAAYLFAPDVFRTAAIAGVVAITYVYALLAMKKPQSAR